MNMQYISSKEEKDAENLLHSLQKKKRSKDNMYVI